MSETEAIETSNPTPAPRDTRCRYCWARITRGEPVVKPNAELSGGIVVKPEVYNVFFHANCPQTIQPFPVIGKVDDAGNDIGPEPPDDPYARRRFELGQ